MNTHKPYLCHLLATALLLFAVSPMLMAKALHDAAEQGNLHEVTRLIEDGMDVNEHGMGGDTPLHEAAKGGHLDVVKLLIAKGANVNAKSDSGNTPLHSAASLGDLEVVKFLISKGADVNAESQYGATPLHSAAQAGNASVVEFLISQGVDVNALTNDGRTPLDIAYSSGHKETVDLLRRYGGSRQARKGSRQARKCVTAKDIRTINRGIIGKRAFRIKERNAKIFLAVDPRLLTLEGHFALLMEQDIDEIRIWQFKQPPGLGAAVPFVKGCAAEGYGEPDMFDKLTLMQEVVVSIDKYGVDHGVVRDKIGRLLLEESPTTPEDLEAQTDKIISRVRAILEHG